MQNLLNDLKDLLKTDSRFISEGELLKNVIIESALKNDVKLLELLLSQEKFKSHFFIEVKNTLIFKKDIFLRFVNNKDFLPDSYTSFKNKVGLTLDDEFLSGKKDVVLSFPYKDCILEGGQTKEEVNGNRPEIFWNEILAPDEVDRLLEPKVITNFKKIDSKGEHKLTTINPSDNLIINGNNLLTLHSLKRNFAGKIKLIYIDPPYNTGNDSFSYNDRFNHSSWLTFMKNRLEIAKELLTSDGSICIQIDDVEMHYLRVLCDEIFGMDNFTNCICLKRGSVTGHKSINAGLVNVKEFILIYCKDRSKWKPNRVFRARERNVRYDRFIKNRSSNPSKWKFVSLMDAFSEKMKIPKTELRAKLGNKFEERIFEFIKNNADAVIQFAFPDLDKVSKDAMKIIKQSQKEPDKTLVLKREGVLDLYLKGGSRILFYNDRLKEIDGELVTAEPLSDFWDDVLPNDLHREGLVTLKKGKKSEKLLKRLLDLSTNPGDLILDFFLGSGTSAAVAHKLNRQYIGVEQIDYGKNSSITRLKNVIKGESTGISKIISWKGGGNFVYCELMEWNQKYIDQIQQAKNKDTLKKTWKLIQQKGFLSYKLDIKTFDKNVSEFEKLDFNQQKEFLIEILDKNQLYVNFSEIDDKDFAVSKEDKELNKRFYGNDML